MNLRTWWRWLKSLPWSLQWFVWLILLRPVIDIFWWTKSISPLASPLNIVGVLTPVLIVASYFSKTFPGRNHAAPDPFMGFWGALSLLNAIAALSLEISLPVIELALRLTMPVFLYFYLRHLVRTQEDLRGVVTTFFYATAFPFMMLLYERLVSPLGELVQTRGHGRYEGLYADVNSYAAYISGSFLIACFYFLDHNGRVSIKKRTLRLIVIGGLSIIGLISMHHAASWGVFAALLLLVAFHAVRRGHIQMAFVLLILCIPAYYFLGDTITERVSSMYNRELMVLQGESEMRSAFHGRMWRWQRHLSDWEEMPIVAKLVGIGVHTRPTAAKVGAGIHNDYLRILFSSGWIGLFLYLGFYAAIFIRTVSLPVAERFLVRGAMALVLLYSITATATTSMPVLYIGMAIFAYGARPQRAVRRVVVKVPAYARQYQSALQSRTSS